MAEYVDYDYKPENSGGGKFLNLNAKGDKATIRLAEKPITYFVHWVDNKTFACVDKNTCSTCQRINALPQEEQKKQEITRQKRRQMFIWPVIDRADGQAKVYKATIQVFLGIAELATDPNWGGAEKDATKFDVTITRTEQSTANFYSVIGDPTSITKPLTAEEKAEAEKLKNLIDSIAIMAEQSNEIEHAPEELEQPTTPQPSSENSSSPDDFIASLEADKAKREGEEAQA